MFLIKVIINDIGELALKRKLSPKKVILFYLPFPGTQVENNVPWVLIAVDVMEKTHCSGSKFIVNVLPWMFPCDVYPRLYKLTQQI